MPVSINLAKASGSQASEAPDEDKLALQRYAMVDARLRRVCEIKPSGKCNVPESVHLAWKKGGTSRDELRVLLEQYEFDKDLMKGINRVSPWSF